MFVKEITTEIRNSEEFDILIIGGGILGLAIAREAAERGLSAGLVEKNDFCSATSAATSKLIHGGLRYLENFEFSLVRESLEERRIFMLAASHLVRPLPILIPVFPWTKPHPFLLRLGLKTYDFLSLDRNRYLPEEYHIPDTKYIPDTSIIHEILGFPVPGIKGGFLFYDCLSIHPERLALAILKTASQKGAKFYNHVEIENIIVESKNGLLVKGLEVKDRITGKSATFFGKVIVNATGPWLGEIPSKILKKPVTLLRMSKGIHLLTVQKFSSTHALLLRTKQGRHFFIIPWKGFSLIGPTDTPYDGEPDHLKPTPEDVFSLMEEVNQTLRQNVIKKEDILDIITGIRPLISEKENKHTYKVSRKHRIFHHKEESIRGLVSVAGGKWTTARKIGEEVIKEILKEYPELQKKAITADTSLLPLQGSPGYANPYSIYEEFALKEFRIPEISRDTHKYLISLYGTEHIEILKSIKENPSFAKPILESGHHKEIYAQVVFSYLYEGARTLEDIVKRRMGLGTYGIPDKKVLAKIAEFLAPYAGWSDGRVKKEVEETYQSYHHDVLKSL